MPRLFDLWLVILFLDDFGARWTGIDDIRGFQPKKVTSPVKRMTTFGGICTFSGHKEKNLPQFQRRKFQRCNFRLLWRFRFLWFWLDFLGLFFSWFISIRKEFRPLCFVAVFVVGLRLCGCRGRCCYWRHYLSVF